ncbi:hypothetical protein [Planctopirus hydrillae]|uniref:Uncharacterized protein n=1 Tax=Planctopirus hydrillae TaxID=1841610 RepID=A0A1C3EN23_9PLAN|nr:hypothetical protein [Planctopirus hydrillae]ODA34653.1 hypothetical protein A6X21_02945 [Planctopirus hydrillae]
MSTIEATNSAENLPQPAEPGQAAQVEAKCLNGGTGLDAAAARAMIEAPRALSILMSFAFWILLALVSLSFATLVLSPKLHRREVLTRQYQQSLWELVILQEQTQSLREIAKALEHDERFQAELARSQLGGIGKNEERYPLPEDLLLAHPLEPPAPQLPVPPAQTWREFWIERFATDQSLRSGLIVFCVIGCLFGFGWLHEGAWHHSRLRPVRKLSQWIALRYTRRDRPAT